MYKKIIAVIISVTLLATSLIFPGSAETTADDLVHSTNIKNYANTYWATPVSSHLSIEDGYLTREEFVDNTVYIETFDKNYNLINFFSIDGELERVSGIYTGDEYNFIVCAADNKSCSENAEVIRIIKYTKDWKRLASASVYGSNTTIFTNGGSLRFEQYGDYLYIHSCHEMYNGHQANMTITLHIDTMTITDNKSAVSNNGTGYVSHSFNQFIAADPDTDSIITVDHGDAHPRTIVMFRYKNQLGNSKLQAPEMLNIFSIAGESGDNYTGVTLGDMIITDNNYIIVFDSIEQGKTSTERKPYIAIVPKNSFVKASVKIIEIDSASNSCGAPYITGIGNGKYNVMWESENGVSYITIDENGNKLHDAADFNAQLSDCEPVLVGSDIIWYVTDDSAPVFYSINTITNECKIEKCYHSYKKTVLVEMICESDGMYRYDCAFCGDSYKQTVKTNGHADSNNDGKCDTCHCDIPTDSDLEFSWEKSSYTVNDNKATLYINNTHGLYLTNITCKHSFGASYAITSTQIRIDFDFLHIAGTHHYYITLSDGQVIHAPLTILAEGEEATTATEKETTTETTTATTTETTTESTTEITTETTTETTTTEVSSDETESKSEDSSTQDPVTTTKVTVLTTKIDITLEIETTTAPPPENNTEPTAESTTKPDADEPEYLKGDMNLDGKITAADARTILRIAATLQTATEQQQKNADLDDNGRITASDARKALRIAAGLDKI